SINAMPAVPTFPGPATRPLQTGRGWPERPLPSASKARALTLEQRLTARRAALAAQRPTAVAGVLFAERPGPATRAAAGKARTGQVAAGRSARTRSRHRLSSTRLA